MYLFCRGKIGRGDFLRRHERLGLSYLAKPNSGLALFYAASGVDALALMLLAERLGQLGFRVLVSMRDSEGGRLRPPRLATLLYQLAPLDTPQSVKRFLEHWRPDLVLVCGGELPLNLIFETRRRAIPLVLVNARMPARSFLIWRRLGGLAASLLTLLDGGREADAERFRALGLRSARVTGNLESRCCRLQERLSPLPRRVIKEPRRVG